MILLFFVHGLAARDETEHIRSYIRKYVLTLVVHHIPVMRFLTVK